MRGNEGCESEEQRLQEQMNNFKVEINRQIDELNEYVRLYKAKETNGLNRAEDGYKSVLIFVTYIIDELHELIKTIFDRHRLYIHDIWQALQQNESCEKIGNEFNADINRILQRWERYFQMAEEKLKR